MAKTPVSLHQKFQMASISRKQLVGAPYNPRQIDENAKKKLRNNIRRVGLIQPIIWNKRTGHIVSGHQRIAILDSLERNDTYYLDVAVVDLDEQTEKEQVVFLNNELAMGSFDLPKLDTLLHEINFENCGFDHLDLQVMLPSFEVPATPEQAEQDQDIENLQRGVTEMRANREVEEAQDEVDEKANYNPEELERLRAKKQAERDKANAAHPENTDVEFFIVLVFPNRRASEEFLDMIHVDRGEKYLSGEMIAGLVKKGVK